MPEFGPAETNVTVQREGTAFLDCPVKTAGDRPVSYPLVSTEESSFFLDWPVKTEAIFRQLSAGICGVKKQLSVTVLKPNS